MTFYTGDSFRTISFIITERGDNLKVGNKPRTIF